jgi:hypothetical protein
MTKEELDEFLKNECVDVEEDFNCEGSVGGRTIWKVGEKFYALDFYRNGWNECCYDQGRVYNDPYEVKCIEIVSYSYEPIDLQNEDYVV